MSWVFNTPLSVIHLYTKGTFSGFLDFPLYTDLTVSIYCIDRE